MKIEIDERTDHTFMITCDKAGSAYMGETVASNVHEVLDILEFILILENLNR